MSYDQSQNLLHLPQDHDQDRDPDSTLLQQFQPQPTESNKSHSSITAGSINRPAKPVRARDHQQQQQQQQQQLQHHHQQSPLQSPSSPSPSSSPLHNQQQQRSVQQTPSEVAQAQAAEAQAIASSRAIQAQHQQIQLQNLFALQNGHAMNGMNGGGPGMGMPGSAMNGGGGGGGMVVGPTPAGHQTELNLIYSLVEDLSRQLAENRRQTEELVNGVGRVRNRAREQNLENSEVVGEAADDIYAHEANLDNTISILTESLDRAKNSRDANFNLVASYARVLSSLLAQFHAYKQKHIADVSAWHRSYRAQLAEARAENSRLRDQIWEMQEHAGRANQMLREFRKHYDENEARADRLAEARARRQEIRFWKRMAMPERDVGGEDGEGDESAWSDDDDLIDPAEKERLREIERKVAEQQQQLAGLAGDGQGDGHHLGGEDGEEGGHHGMGMLGGVAMERDMPTPPPRPASTGSTGGQMG
ncbi:hypothetical protein BX600DRAFT_518736 [Xylariales sp. PMI_506]|nr:hypothetical protein BX600DRAFT_518736 [Xylariales sp. PMI_506]